MTRISLELIPRDREMLLSDLQLASTKYQKINSINIPDLLKYKMRSWESCKYTKQYFNCSIPHIRAIDFKLDQTQYLIQDIKRYQIQEVLVIAGDTPQDMSRKVYPTTSIDLIRKLKQEVPELKIYAGLDPYRDSLRQEYERVKRKIDAGADGFFTQPFFDLRFMKIFAEILTDVPVFWGIAPVTSEKSLNYWETKNNVVFPQDFEPTLKWNIDFAKKVLDFIVKNEENVYIMPIRMDLELYLGEIFS